MFSTFFVLFPSLFQVYGNMMLLSLARWLSWSIITMLICACIELWSQEHMISLQGSGFSSLLLTCSAFSRVMSVSVAIKWKFWSSGISWRPHGYRGVSSAAWYQWHTGFSRSDSWCVLWNIWWPGTCGWVCKGGKPFSTTRISIRVWLFRLGLWSVEEGDCCRSMVCCSL